MISDNVRVRKVFTTRSGGVSRGAYHSFNLADHVGDDPAAVQANRARLARVLGLRLSDLVFMEAIHSPTVTVVTDDLLAQQPQMGQQGAVIPATDAMVTTLRSVALVVLAADCVPVLLSDSHAGVIAAVHAGRLGSRNGIVSNTMKVMAGLGARPQRVHALLGPAAAGKDYEVPSDMAADVERFLPGSRVRTSRGTVGLDLRLGLIRQLHSLGVAQIDSDPRSTVEDTQFFSYRRDGVTGRHAGVIWMSCQ